MAGAMLDSLHGRFAEAIGPAAAAVLNTNGAVRGFAHSLTGTSLGLYTACDRATLEGGGNTIRLD